MTNQTAPEFPRPISQRDKWITLALMLGALLLTLPPALQNAPNGDEALFASAGVDLARNGVFSTSIIEPAGSPLRNIDRLTFHILPFHGLVLSCLYRLMRPTLLTLRMFSAVCSALIIAIVYLFLRAWDIGQGYGILAGALIALERAWFGSASTGRPDMLCLLLGLAGTIVLLRSSDLKASTIFGSSALVSLSILTHPKGAAYVIAWCTIFVYIVQTRRPVRSAVVRALGYATIPPLTIGLAYITYAAQDIVSFKIQMSQNNGVYDRHLGLHAPLIAITQEISQWVRPAIPNDGRSSVQIFYWLISGLYLAAIAVVFYRRKALPAAISVLLIAIFLGNFFTFTIIDSTLQTFNIPFRTLVLNITFVLALWCIRTGPSGIRWLSRAAAGVLVVLFLARDWAFVRSIERDTREYARVCALLSRLPLKPGSVVLGPLEFAFYYGFNRPFRNDLNLGYYSGLEPAVVISNRHVNPPDGGPLDAEFLDGLCVGREQQAAGLLRWEGHYYADMVARDRTGLCAHARKLSDKSKLLASGPQYSVYLVGQ